MLDVAPAQAQALAGQGALLLHRVYLVGFKSKITTVISWTVTSLSARRGQLTIKGPTRTRTAQLQDISAPSPNLDVRVSQHRGSHGCAAAAGG